MRKIKVPFERGPADKAGEVDYFPCHISGEPWRYAMVTSEQMKILSEDSTSEPADGLCSAADSTIYYRKGMISHTVAIHELAHAHFAETLTHSATLTADQVEEVMCDIMAFNWCRNILLARVMVHNMLCYEEYLKGNKKQDWEECPADVLNGPVADHLLDLVATYITSSGLNPLLRAAIGKKKRGKRS